LRDDDRNVIELCVMGELPPSTVAMLLGQRSSTVRSRLARARRRLADAYTRVSDPDTR
jgi:DNA-directed RNA polymerase specialized sigma24 family protein